MINIWIGNLAKYNEGELVGEWISLPCEKEELDAHIQNILGNDEEIFIADYECDFLKVQEFSNPYYLNELAEKLQNTDIDALEMIIEHYYPEIEEALEIASNTEKWSILTSVKNYRDLAYELVIDQDYLGHVPSHLENYLDYEQIADEIDANGEWKINYQKEFAFRLEC